MNAITVVYPDEHFFFIKNSLSRELNSSNNKDILQQIFDQWNHGSGKESDQFLNAKVRSLSVNDVVIVNRKYYQCKSVEWKDISEQEFLNIENGKYYAFKSFGWQEISEQEFLNLEKGKYYQCKSIGWQEISEQEFLNLEKAVATHPRRFKDGSWLALQDVMQRTNSLA